MLTAMAAAFGCGGPSVNPSSVEFGPDTYKVQRPPTSDGGFLLTSTNETVRLEGLPSDARHLAPCPPPVLIVHDFDRDRRPDLALYTCSFLQIYVQGSSRLSRTAAIEAQHKEGRWIGIDSGKYQGIKELTRDFVHRLDPDA